MIQPFNLTSSNLLYLKDKLDRLDFRKQWVVTIAERKKTRTNAQNARYWAFITAFGSYLGYEREEMHEICKYKFLSEHVEIGGDDVVKLKSTPKTDTKEFSEYCENCERWASQLGFAWLDERLVA